MFKEVFLGVPKCLIKILKKSYSDIKNLEIVLLPSREGFNFNYDYYITITLLPYYLKEDLHNLSKFGNYITADTKLVKKYEKRISDKNKIKIGLCWQSSTNV